MISVNGWGAGRLRTVIDPDLLSPEKRAQILQGAAVVFDRDGYEGASMSQIAREANVSKGTLYNHFESKADLFAAYVGQRCSTCFEPLLQAVDPVAKPAAALLEFGRRMVTLMVSPEARSVYRTVISEAGTFPELAQAFFKAGRKNSVHMLARWIEREVADGRLRVEDPEFAAEQFFALCQADFVTRYRLHLIDMPGRAEIDRVATGAVEMFLARYKAA